MEDGKGKGIDDLWWNPTPFDGESGFKILRQLINSGLNDIALALLQDKPKLAFFIPEKENHRLDQNFLMAIAQKPSSFRSGASFNFFQNKIYSCVPLKLENITEHKRKPDIENAAKGCIYGVYSVPCIKHIREKKMIHHDAHELVKFICKEIVQSNYSSAEKIFSPPLFQAVSSGIHEITQAILRSYPNAIYLRNQKKQSIFHHAIVCRCENVFNLIHRVEESKTIFLSQWDESRNNALHLAGYLASQQQLNLRAGAALQMQRELQWFKEVEKHILPRNKEERNYKEMTPAEVFTDTHKDLVKEGEQWMKGTANACSIVAALIATVVFAAAITVPGGNNGNGSPIFNKRASFLIFGIFDAFALFSSITSVLLFLSILTSRYAEDDFLVTLPRRLIFGLLTLFLSILSTMIAFGATLYLVFEESYKAWIIIPVFVLPVIPVGFFVFLQSPLLLDMFKSTYCSIFLKQSDGMLY
ncbi:ankyrin repeat-containing protein ITN1-like isoform X3 [Camellia sinensis]|nr:ankyrin repeat-containing protein ITN1-like isoform X3 [Camellia sinensis]